MSKLSKPIKQEMINSIKSKVSINKISKSLGIGKSTIYYHYKKIKGRKNKKLNLDPKFEEIEGEIVGIFTGDGSQTFIKKRYHYFVNVHFGIKNIGYAYYVKNIFENYFDKKFRLYKVTPPAYKVTTYSKEIWDFFKFYLDYNPKIKHSTVFLREINVPDEFKIGFIRGLFDTDGSILYCKHTKRIRIAFCTTSVKLIEQVKVILREFDIIFGYKVVNRRHLGYKDLYTVVLFKKSNDKFLKTFRPYKERLLKKGPVIQSGQL